MNIRSITLAGFTVAFAGLAAQAQTVSVMGSTALGPIIKKAANDFRKVHPEVNVVVSGGGSMTGLNQVTSGGCTIGISDVFATPDQEKGGIKNNNIVIEPFTLVVNPSVPVRNLSTAQAKAIFTGKVNNWKEVGGPDVKIVRINRPESSGTRAVQKQIVNQGEEFSNDQLIQDSSGAVLTALSTTKGAIGFVELDFLAKNKGKVEGVTYNGAACSLENVKQGKYSIFSYGHAYLNPGKTDPKTVKAAEAFLAFMLTKEFQEGPVIEAGYMPVSYAKSLKTKL